MRIDNPLPGGTNYTSRRAAERIVERGSAIWIGLNVIAWIEGIAHKRFLLAAEEELRRERDIDRAIAAGRGGTCDWRGTRKTGGRIYSPGIVRS